jgi:hypothetical protein
MPGSAASCATKFEELFYCADGYCTSDPIVRIKSNPKNIAAN